MHNLSLNGNQGGFHCPILIPVVLHGILSLLLVCSDFIKHEMHPFLTHRAPRNSMNPLQCSGFYTFLSLFPLPAWPLPTYSLCPASPFACMPVLIFGTISQLIHNNVAIPTPVERVLGWEEFCEAF